MKGFEIPKFVENEQELTVTINTERLCLTSVTEKQKGFYYQYLYGNKEVMKTYGKGEVLSEEAVTQKVTLWSNRWKSKDPFSSLAICKKENMEFVGHVNLGYGNETQEPGVAELGYQIAQKYWGQGFASEAILPVVKLYAQELANKKYTVNGAPFTTLVAAARVDNPASLKVLEKSGMTYIKEEPKYGHMRKHFKTTYSGN